MKLLLSAPLWEDIKGFIALLAAVGLLILFFLIAFVLVPVIHALGYADPDAVFEQFRRIEELR